VRAVRASHLGEHRVAQRRLLPSGMETRGRPLALDGGRPAVPIARGDRRHPDASARVPDRFRERQWSRLPGGEKAEAFAEHARRLLGNGEASVATEVGPAHTQPGAMPAVMKSSLSKWLIAGLGVVVVALAAFIAFRAPIKEPAARRPALAGVPAKSRARR